MDVEEIATASVKNPIPPQLARYAFQPGQKPPQGVGRPKGVKNAQTILLKSAPRLAKTYIKEALKGSAPLLKDAREWIMPVEDRSAATAPSITLVFAGLPLRVMPGDSVAQTLAPTASGTPSLSGETVTASGTSSRDRADVGG